MEVFGYIVSNWPLILSRTGQHVQIVAVAVGLAILTGVPIGVAITRNKRAADAILYIASIIITIPSIALFGIMIPILSFVGGMIGVRMGIFTEEARVSGPNIGEKPAGSTPGPSPRT